MNESIARWRIIWVWLFGLLTSMVLAMYADFALFGSVDPPVENFRTAINGLYIDLCTWYALPLTAMFGVMFAFRRNASRASDLSSTAQERARVSSRIFHLAFAVSLVWNVLLVAQVVRTTILHALDLQDLTEWIRQYVKATGFLISPVLGYFFALRGDQ